MGSSGMKRRRGAGATGGRRGAAHPQHLPKVGSRPNLEYEHEHAGAAVLENFGVHETAGSRRWLWWGVLVVLVAIAALAIFALGFWH